MFLNRRSASSSHCFIDISFLCFPVLLERPWTRSQGFGVVSRGMNKIWQIWAKQHIKKASWGWNTGKTTDWLRDLIAVPSKMWFNLLGVLSRDRSGGVSYLLQVCDCKEWNHPCARREIREKHTVGILDTWPAFWRQFFYTIATVKRITELLELFITVYIQKTE